MVGRRGSRRAHTTSSRLGPRRGEPPPRNTVGSITLEELGQFITKVVEEAVKKNQEASRDLVNEQEKEQEKVPGKDEMGQRSQVGGTIPPPGMDDQEKEEVWREIRMLRQQLGGKGSTFKKENPFSLAILEEELPASFKKPSVGEYDESKDPEEHMGRFENAALLHQYSDGIKCRFASSKKYQKTYLSLFVMKQQDQETLREFIQRFNGAALEVPTATPDILISAFTQGLKGGEFFKSLVKKPQSSYDDLLARAKKYVNLEDAQKHRRTEQRQGGSNVEGADKGGRKRGMGEREDDRARGKGKFSPYAPLAQNRDKVMKVEEKRKNQGSLQRIDEGPKLPPPMRRSRTPSRGSQEFHSPPRRRRGPPWINQEMEEPRMDIEGQSPSQGFDQRRRMMDDANNPTRSVIRMISGGATDDSGRAREAHRMRMENFEISKELNLPQDPIISFGPKDLRGVAAPHNDTLLVKVTIENYDVARIFVDSGSSVNVLFKGTMDQMKIEGFELGPISTPLYGFTGHAIRPMGQIDLPMYMGMDPKRVTKMVSFTVVDASSSYNGILGRPAMKDFKAIASTYHQKLKFPVGREVGVLRGDQMVARRCYDGVVREGGKRARMKVNMIRSRRSILSMVEKKMQVIEEEESHEEVKLGSCEKKLSS
ncbi:uncharacterized protein [Henckelia pumila]|uniref:uncharacterized protein n=1 Tax=Henckelia pumila TaxID=405737 RepID=UPI003C6DD795